MINVIHPEIRLVSKMTNRILLIASFLVKMNCSQRTDSTKDYIALKSKPDNIKSIIKELKILQNDSIVPFRIKINLKDSLDTLSDLQEEAEETKVSFLVLLSNYERKNETVNNTSMNNHVKLPDLPLPTFIGKFQEFEQFKLQFMNLIGNNPSLNEVHKLCYFKGALKNEASLIQSDQDAFDSLMKAFEIRYENIRALVDIHIAKIISINKLYRENPSQIRSIVDKVRNHLRSLKNLNFESNPLSDAIILHVLSNKVDKESQRLFHLSLSLTTTKVPSLDEFISLSLSFLELRCIQLEAVIKPPEIVAKNVPIK
ncbi:integrase catalytic domain-containing protein [Trichonephila clavata]|uniref:Integrase catalytic domain-containing protein n=1 Tax=Trichonephila clavata TaxID=2740835 RepID=A0A8X6LCG8_TRICU|nr:integrase catalytic domain-containing protein [Trichonephila clavata]